MMLLRQQTLFLATLALSAIVVCAQEAGEIDLPVDLDVGTAAPTEDVDTIIDEIVGEIMEDFLGVNDTEIEMVELMEDDNVTGIVEDIDVDCICVGPTISCMTADNEATCACDDNGDVVCGEFEVESVEVEEVTDPFELEEPVDAPETSVFPEPEWADESTGKEIEVDFDSAAHSITGFGVSLAVSVIGIAAYAL